MLEQSFNYPQRTRRLITIQVMSFAILGALVGILISLFAPGGWLLAALGAVAAGGFALWQIHNSASTVLGPLKTYPLTEDQAPRLWNLLDGLCLANGIVEPDIRVIETDSVNSLAVGREPANTTLVVTRGMLQRLTRVELEAVLARHLAQIKTGETALGTAIIPLLRVSSIVSRQGWLASRLLQDQFDIMADLEGVNLTRYPPALAEALHKVAVSAVVSNVSVTSGHLWLGCPFEASSLHLNVSPIDHRIDVLQEL